MSKWHTTPLGELTINHDGKRRPVKETDREPGPYPYYGASGIVDYVSDYLIDGDYLLIAEDGENLRTRQTPIAFMARGKSWVNNHAHIVTGNERADTRFLMYAIQAQDVSPYLTGAVMPKLTQGNLNKIPITHPKEMEDQRAIAHILGTLDDKIELNRRMNETLEAMARAIFKSWFVDFDPVRAKANGEPPDSICRRLGLTPDVLALFPDSFQDSELGEIPAGWSVKALRDVINVNPSRTLRKGISAPYLDMANMPTRSARAADTVMREFGSGMKFANGDTLVARITPCLENGKTCFVDFLCNGVVGWGSTEYIVLRPKPPLPVEYAYFLARTDSFRSHAIANMTGTSGRQRVPAGAIENFRLVVPREDGLGVAFGGLAGALLTLMKTRDEESRSLTHVRDTLLPKLLSGKLSPAFAEAAA